MSSYHISGSRYLATIVIAITPILSACKKSDVTGPAPDAIVLVGIALGSPGYIPDAYLTVGDQDTVWSQVYTGGWPSHIKYDSEIDPKRFQFSSSNPQVATVDVNGILTTHGIGTTVLHASTGGVESPPLTLTVSPAAAQLVMDPAELIGKVGDTLAVAIRALDSNGQSVRDVPFSVFPDTTYWAVTSPPLESSALKTPMVLHFQGKMVGHIRLIATVRNNRAASRLHATVPITIRAP